MAALDNLIETLNANNFFVPVSVCVVVSAVLLFTVIKWLSKSDKRDKAVSFDVDDLDKEIQGSLKKTKQRKAKATTAQADSSSNSARSKITGKQTQSVAAKVAAPASKEKQTDTKAKASGKKQTAPPASSKPVQPSNELQGEWLVAGSKKKQKPKKTGTDVQESKTKDEADRQTNEVEVGKTHKSIADKAPKDIEQQHEVLVDSLEREDLFVARESTYDTVSGASSSEADVVVSQPSRHSYDEPLVKDKTEEPVVVESASEVRIDEGNVEADPVGKEPKSKKSSKKKKSKAVSEPTQMTDFTAQKAPVTSSQQDDSSRTMANIPSSSVLKPEAAQLVETVYKSDLEPVKVKSKDAVAKEAKVAVPDASKDVVKVAAKSVVKVAAKSKDAVPEASKEVVPDSSKGVINDDSKKIVPDASVDGPAAQLVVFDELGLTDSSADVAQPALKKKKKARKDI